jgi:N-acyl homoserine lactone hydrolase
MRVHAIQTGRVRIKASQVVGRGHGLKRRLAPLIDSEWSAWLPTFAYAIEHRDGVILVDTGASAAAKSLPRWHPNFRNAVRFDIEPDEEAAPQLRAIGIGSSDVRRVVLTHLHIDHDGGLGAFPTSEILVSPGELQRASGIAGRLRGYLPQRWPKHFDPKSLVLDAGRYGPFARSKRLTADGAIVAVATPGHSPDHLSVVVEDEDRPSSSPATRPTARRRCLPERSTASATTRGKRRRRSPPFRPSPRRRRRSICRRTIPTQRAGSLTGSQFLLPVHGEKSG